MRPIEPDNTRHPIRPLPTEYPPSPYTTPPTQPPYTRAHTSPSQTKSRKYSVVVLAREDKPRGPRGRGQPPVTLAKLGLPRFRKDAIAGTLLSTHTHIILSLQEPVAAGVRASHLLTPSLVSGLCAGRSSFPLLKTETSAWRAWTVSR
ncbi:hypothetical protein KC19_6G027100 [Ceratodon purpureus]|uniref:Uncharacterized protein n=1 Tax=Ceratodon purpureus TaxID=3225 RepID=A0A8T0H9L0_CERPU|nr:hypothetical protein KC19_6G027100 [Ceratodon purpureus]